jgi:hypothetical protein
MVKHLKYCAVLNRKNSNETGPKTGVLDMLLVIHYTQMGDVFCLY